MQLTTFCHHLPPEVEDRESDKTVAIAAGTSAAVVVVLIILVIGCFIALHKVMIKQKKKL